MSPELEGSADGLDLIRFARMLGDRLIEENRHADDLVEVGDILEVLAPYRTCRNVLSIASHEDYESLILRLCAGERGLAITEPPGIAEVFRDQAESPNPDLSIVSDLRSTLIRLVPGALRTAPESPDEQYAPPLSEPADEVADSELPLQDTAGTEPVPPPTIPDSRTPSPVPTECDYCGGALPTGRQVNFCPHCGENLTRVHCPDCGQEAEPGWRHCVSCGHAFK